MTGDWRATILDMITTRLCMGGRVVVDEVNGRLASPRLDSTQDEWIERIRYHNTTVPQTRLDEHTTLGT
jgi:hypothetical protein